MSGNEASRGMNTAEGQGSREDEVAQFVREVVAEFIEIPDDQVDVEADLFEIYAIESLQLVELMTAVEGRFGVHLEFDDFKPHRTVSSVSLYVLERIVG